MKKILIFLFSPLLFLGQSYVWQQYGTDINSVISYNNVSFSDDGQTLVSSNPLANSNNGAVTVFRYTNSNWFQLGNSIVNNGAYANSGFGAKVAMDGTGNTIAFCIRQTPTNIIKIYSYNGTDWVQKGADITGLNSENFGYDSSFYWSQPISFSNDGNTIAIGTNKNSDTGSNSGKVRIYNYSNGNWQQLGSDLKGITGELFGTSVELSNNGNILAVGAPGNASIGSNNGAVKVFSFNGTDWQQLGNTVYGSSASQYVGKTLSMNANGDSFIINLRNNKIYKVYKYSGTDWLQIGQDISDTTGTSTSYWTVDMNAQGDRVAVSVGRTGAGYSTGIQTYDYNGTSWVKNIADLTSSNDSAYYYGRYFKLNSDGNYLSTIYYKDETDAPVKVYKNSGSTLSVPTFYGKSKLNIYPNPVKEKINVKSSSEISLIEIYDSNGIKVLNTIKSCSIDLSQLTKGVYILKATFHNGEKSSIKIIKE
ncbi:MAG: hypothetical protein DI529_16140 [Chryseobacterium sp.]|nr:MAG: hypothetical protein DI529_16140 [Chryseobacterium sp.]